MILILFGQKSNKYFCLFVVNQGPILPDHIKLPHDGLDLELPSWAKSAAKMLNGGSEGQDWIALAQKLGWC